MKLIRPRFEIWDQQEGLEGVYKQIERAGRVCYKSEDKITETSAKEFVDRMIKLGHGAMLEHGTVYLKFNNFWSDEALKLRSRYNTNKYSICQTKKERLGEFNPLYQKKKHDEKWRIANDSIYITTNLRVLVENDWVDDLKYICEPTENHEERLTIHFTTQIAISREFNRHRVNSMAEQSTRYCNYGKDKFDGVGINLPSWVDSEIQRLEDITENVLPTFEQLKKEYFSVSDQGITKDDWGDIEWWLWSNLVAEESYLKLIEKGRKPQEARVVLPLDTNTELIHTAFVSDWNHFFGLRDDSHAHPDARLLAHPLHKEFIKRNYIV